MEILYGGKLKQGDLIAIANGNTIQFGWFAGQGRGTLQYWYVSQPASSYEHYQEWLNSPEHERSKHYSKMYEKGFTAKLIWKSYINAVHDTRVMKVTNPEDVFPAEKKGWHFTLEEYEKSKEVLIKLNIINQ